MQKEMNYEAMFDAQGAEVFAGAMAAYAIQDGAVQGVKYGGPDKDKKKKIRKGK